MFLPFPCVTALYVTLQVDVNAGSQKSLIQIACLNFQIFTQARLQDFILSHAYSFEIIAGSQSRYHIPSVSD